MDDTQMLEFLTFSGSICRNGLQRLPRNTAIPIVLRDGSTEMLKIAVLSAMDDTQMPEFLAF